MNLITCTHCGKEIEISEALTHQLRLEIEKEASADKKKEIEEARRIATAEAEKKYESTFEEEKKRLKEEAEQNAKRNTKLIEEITELTKALRIAKEEKDEAQLKAQKEMQEELMKLKEESDKKAEEAQHTKMMEKDKVIADLQKSLEDAKRRAEQGSQQLQGEVFEEEFEGILAQRYPNDQINPVGKGVRGGDIVQEVWDKNGNMVGKILWELKNTKTWSEGWIDKLRSDQRTLNAEEAVLITAILPTDMTTAGFRNNIWVTKRDFVMPLADTLRAKLIQLHYAKNSVKGKNEKMEILYAYLSGTEFKHRVEAIIESFTSMQQEIEKEKRYFSNKWARDEKNIRQVIDNTIGMHGDMKGIIGSSLPQITGLTGEDE